MYSRLIGYLFIIMGVLMTILSIYLFLQNKKDRLKDKRYISFYFFIEIICWFFASFGVSDTATNSLVYPLKDNVNIKLLPGTIVVGATVPMCFMSFSYLMNSEVAPLTLFSLIIGQSIGAIIGAKVVTKLNEHILRIVLGSALICAATLLAIKLFVFYAEGGNKSGLSSVQLTFMFFFMILTGFLAMVGFGSTIPNMAALLLMGMSPLNIYPIIMSTNCFICFAGCLEFIKSKCIHPQIVLIETISGLFGVFLAMKFVANINSFYLQILMIVVMLLSASQMIIKEIKSRKK